MRGGAAATVCALLGSCAHVASSDDPVLSDLEDGYQALRAGRHEHARATLSRALGHFDDLALEGGALEHALASDPNKPYRGRAHERVLTALLVAALDAEAGRCDMVSASLRNAHYLAAKTDARVDIALPLGDAIAFACRTQTPLQIELVGRGPQFHAAGAHDHALAWEPGSGDDVWGRITIGALERRALEPARDAWSTTVEAQRVAGRKFDAVLAQRAQHKDRAGAEGRERVEQGLGHAHAAVRDASVKGDERSLAAAALQLGAGAALGATAGAIDARVDARFVALLPERVRVRSAPPASAAESDDHAL